MPKHKCDATIVVNQMEYDLFSIHAQLAVWLAGTVSSEETWKNIRDIINGQAETPILEDDTDERRAERH